MRNRPILWMMLLATTVASKNASASYTVTRFSGITRTISTEENRPALTYNQVDNSPSIRIYDFGIESRDGLIKFALATPPGESVTSFTISITLFNPGSGFLTLTEFTAFGSQSPMATPADFDFTGGVPLGLGLTPTRGQYGLFTATFAPTTLMNSSPFIGIYARHFSLAETDLLNIKLTVLTVPEPSSLTMVGVAGLLGLFEWARRRRKIGIRGAAQPEATSLRWPSCFIGSPCG